MDKRITFAIILVGILLIIGAIVCFATDNIGIGVGLITLGAVICAFGWLTSGSKPAAAQPDEIKLSLERARADLYNPPPQKSY